MNFKTLTYLFVCILIVGIPGFAQRISVKGIVVDSVSLASLPNVNIRIKHSGTGTTSNNSGSFSIEAKSMDTLIFTCVGYKKLEYPLFDEEEEVLIRLTEEYILLKEVTTIAPETETAVKERKIVTPSLAEGIFSPFTYFSKTEKEKRKLVKLRAENKKIKTYVQFVNDPELKEEIMERFSLKEKDYYEILAKFNKQNRQAAYMQNPEEIKKLLFSFFKTYAP